MFRPLKSVLTPKVTDSLLRSPLAYELLGDYARFYYSCHHKTAQGIWLDFTAKELKAAWQRKGLVAWGNAFFPFELLYGLDLVPCHPETLAALAAKAGLSREAIYCTTDARTPSTGTCGRRSCPARGSASSPGTPGSCP